MGRLTNLLLVITFCLSLFLPSESGECGQSISHIINKYKITIPDISLEAVGYAVDVRKISCGNMSFEDVNIDIDSQTYNFVFGLNQLALVCSADFSYHPQHLSFLPSGSGSISTNVGKSSSLKIGVGLVRDNATNALTGLEAKSCTASIHIDGFNFDGENNDLFRQLSGGLVGNMEGQMNKVICEQASVVVRNLSPMMVKFLPGAR